jgi:hypothetical protein
MGYIVYEFNDEAGFGMVNPGQVPFLPHLRFLFDRVPKIISVQRMWLEPFPDARPKMWVNFCSPRRILSSPSWPNG